MDEERWEIIEEAVTNGSASSAGLVGRAWPLLRWSGLGAAAALAMGAGAAWALLRRSRPQASGQLRMEGLHGPVEILRDRWGVPHVYAGDVHDLYFCQGFCHAQDRLWQMEFNRRLASGRLSEVLGEAALEVDRLMRRIGMHRSARRDAETADDETRALYDAYAAGVNAFLALGRPLPPEFTILRFRPGLWEAANSALMGRLISFGQGLNWDSEIARLRMVTAVGPELAAELEPAYQADMPLAVPPGGATETPTSVVTEDLAGLAQTLGVAIGGGSNNWAVDGTKSASGSPILASDPHISASMPCTWYQVHLDSPEHKVAGASLVGLPGVAIGHNDRIAWGITNGMVDSADIYVEHVDPQNPRRYEYDGGWEEGEVVREEIRVKGRDEPVVEDVLITRHGPDIGPALPGETQHLALRSIALDGLGLVGPGHRLGQARDWDSFRDALRGWETLAMNFAYADVDGNIGYHFVGRLPVRGRGAGGLPAPGWDPAYEWTGTIPFDELPNAFNPASHFVASANARVIGDDYPHYLGNDWADGWRHKRIAQVLAEREALTPDDMARLQVDDLSLPARELMPFLRRLEPQTDLGRTARELLIEWDCRMSVDSGAGAVFASFFLELYRLVFGARLHDALEIYLGKGAHVVTPANGYVYRAASNLIATVREARADWFPAENGRRPTWESVGAQALDQAAAFLSERLGKDASRWRWGDLHHIRFNHPLGQVKPLDRLFSRGPYAVPGDPNTVFQNSYHPLEPFEVTLSTASYRQVIDLGDLNESRSTIYAGQSGHPLSPHYNDLTDGWLHGELHPMPWNRENVEAVTEATLRLEPAAP
jgi:penicillin amidase